MKKFLLVLLLLSATLPLLVFADTPPPPTTPPTTTPPPTATDDDGVAFVSLTNIPALEGAGNAATLPAFVNSLYKIAIGLAAVLAVLQIIRAGIMYMGGDSVTEKKEAKNLIALSIGGLVLILSPVIVFSIINPSILDLKIGGLSELADTETTAHVPGGSVTSGGAGGGTANTCGAYVSVGTVAQATACSTLGAGYEDVVGACSLCQPAAGRKCCGTKTVTNAKFGWKTWYLVPKTGGGTESRLLQSAIFSSSAACLTHASDSTKIPAGSTVDRSDGKGFVCSCATELRLQGTACTPWAVSTTGGGGGGVTPTPGPNVDRPLTSRFYVYRPITGSPAPRGPVPASKTAHDAYVSACTAKPGTVSEDYGNSEVCTNAELNAYTGSDKTYIKCMPVTTSCGPR